MSAPADSAPRMTEGQGAEPDAIDRHPPIDGSGDPQAIERSIDRTRDRLDRILDALQDKLSPGQMFDRALDYVKRNGGELAANFGQRVKEDPLPLLLTAVGFAWLISTSGRASRAHGQGADGIRGVRDRARDTARGISDASGELFEHVGESAGNAADQVRRAANAAGRAANQAGRRLADASQAVREHSREAGAGLSRLLREQPLLMGVVALAAGALFAAVLPHTDAEDQWIGKTRDDGLAQAKRAANDAYGRVRAAAREAVQQSSAADTGELSSTRTH